MSSDPSSEFKAETIRRLKEDVRDAALFTATKITAFTLNYAEYASRAQLKTLDAAAETLREIRKGITYSE